MNHYYETVEGWFNSRDFYRDMVARCPDGGTMVEVGCWKGRSLSCLLVEAANSGKQLKIIGVDHWKGSINEPMLLEGAAACDLRAICEGNCRRAGYPFQLITAYSTAANVGLVDFVFLDDSHDYESVCAGILAWIKRLKPGGIIAGHDANSSGVPRARKELLPDANVTHCCCWWKEIELDNDLQVV